MSVPTQDPVIEATPELKQLGFDKFSIPIRGKTMFVWYNDKPLLCSFERDDLAKTVKALTKKFKEMEIDVKLIRLFVTYFTEEYLRIKEAEHLELSAASSLISNDERATTQQILEGIKKLQAANDGIVLEKWQAGLIDRYTNLRVIAEKSFPNSWFGIEFTLSVLKILNISEGALPFAGIMLARGGGNKTLSSSMIIPWPQAYYTRNFTARAFVSHNTAVSKEDLKDIDMLPKIRFKLLLTPELTPAFYANEDELLEILGIVTSILDGKGYVSHSGAHGRRGEDTMGTICSCG